MNQASIAACLEASGFAVSIRSLRARISLFIEDESTDRVHELLSGVVSLSRTLPDARRQVVGFVFPGEIFTPSGLAFHTSDAPFCTAETLTPVKVALYRRSHLDDLLHERPDMTRSLLAASRRSLFRAQGQMLLLGRMSAIERLASFLLMMAEQQDVTGPTPLHLPMSRRDIADYLGIRIETVSRGFARFQASGLIKSETRTTLRIMNRDRLLELAGR